MYKKALFKLDMLGRASTKMLNSRKMLDGNGIEKASLTQYVRRDWLEKPLLTENARLGWYKKAPLTTLLYLELARKSSFC